MSGTFCHPLAYVLLTLLLTVVLLVPAHHANGAGSGGGGDGDFDGLLGATDSCAPKFYAEGRFHSLPFKPK